MLVKCQICKKSIDRDAAYKRTVGKTNKYYCSKEEYNAEEERKKKLAEDRDNIYRFICDILGENEITNTVLFKEWQIWSQVADNEKIAKYLGENKDYLTNALSRISGSEYNRIRYLSAILKNNLKDFKPKMAEQPRTVEIDMTIYNTPTKSLNKRRSLADLEDGI